MSIIIEFNFTVIDGKSPPEKSHFSVYAYGSINNYPVEELNLAANVIALIFRETMRGGIISCHIGYQVDLASALGTNPLLGIPDPDSDVEEGAITEWLPDDDWLGTLLLRIPTFREDLLHSGTRVVDETEPDFASLIDMMQNGVPIPPASPIGMTTSRGENIVQYGSGKENFKRRKNKRKKR